MAHLIGLSRRLYGDRAGLSSGASGTRAARGRYEVRGKVLGVLGLGNIGRQIARVAEGLGLKIRFFDSRPAPTEVGIEFGWEPTTTIRDLFRSSDYVSVHLSAADVHGDSNSGILDGDVLEQLGADRPKRSPRIFLNLSRGFLHSSESLLRGCGIGWSPPGGSRRIPR